MNLQQLLKRTEGAVTQNSPAILTAIGVAGTLATAYLTGKATLRAVEILGMEDDRIDMGYREQFKLVWMEYIPPALSCGVTIGAIIASHNVSSRRAAAVASAFAITEKAYTEYKEKVVELHGENKERKVRESIAQDKIDRLVPNREVILVGDKSLFLDAYSGRTFEATYQEVLAAQNYINYELINNMHASLSDFYDRVGLDHTSNSDNIGWNCDKQLELEINAGVTKTMQPCLVVTFRTHPFPEYGNLH